MKTVIQQLKDMPEIKVPFEIAKFLPCENASKLTWDFSNTNVSLGDSCHPGDYGSVEEWRKVVEYFARQFGVDLIVWKE